MADQHQRSAPGKKPAQRSLFSRRNLIIIIVAGFIAMAALLFGGSSGSQNWQPVQQSIGHPLVLLQDSMDQGKIFAGVEAGKIYTTTDGGQNWQNLSNGLSANTPIVALAETPNDAYLYASGAGGVFMSSDNGLSWKAISTGLPKYDVVDTLALGDASGSVIYAGTTNSGVYVTKDGGKQWSALSSGLPVRADVYHILVSQKYTEVYAALTPGGIYTLQNGASWRTAGTGIPASTDVFALLSIAQSSGKAPILLAGTDNGLYTSADSGLTWKAQSNGLSSMRVLSLYSPTQLSALVLAGTDTGVFSSVNSGTSWARVQNKFISTDPVASVSAINPTTNGAILFAASNTVYRYPGTGNGFVLGAVRIIGLLILLALLLIIVSQMNQFSRQYTAPPLILTPEKAALRKQMARQEKFNARENSTIRRGGADASAEKKDKTDEV